jgi:hypothetical protein
MNNEVLRRKMFRTVLADSRAPAGILASSPEMVDTVSRRANGGLEARRRLAGQQFMRQFAGMPEGSSKPDYVMKPVFDAARSAGRAVESYLEVLERVKNLPYNQQVEELTKAGYGATIGPDVPDFLSRTGDAAKQRIGADIEQTKQTLGKVLAPGADKPVIDAIQSGIVSVKDALGLIGPADAGMPGGEAPVKNRTPLSATDLVVPTDNDEFGNIAPDGTMPTNVVPDNVGSETTAAEELAENQNIAAAANKEINASDNPKQTTLNISDTVSKLRSNLDAALTGGKPTNKINPKQGEKDSTFAAFAGKLAERATPDEVDLEAIDKLVKETVGFDPDQAKEDRKGAFWNAVITAGLSIAAGESQNALTNIAKGLGFAFDQYGKRIGELTAQEREDQKEARRLRFDLIQSEKQANIAKAAADDAFNQRQIQNMMDFEKTKDEKAYREATLANQNAQIRSNFEINAITLLQKQNFQDQSLEIQRDTLNETIRKNMLPDSETGKLLLDTGMATVNDDGVLVLNEKGQEALPEGFLVNFVQDFAKKETALSTSTGKVAVPIQQAAALTRVLEGRPQPGDRELAMSSEAYKTAAKDQYGASPEDIFAFLGANQSALGGEVSGTDTPFRSIPEFDVAPDGQTLAALAKAGVTQVKVGGKTFPIVQSN